MKHAGVSCFHLVSSVGLLPWSLCAALAHLQLCVTAVAILFLPFSSLLLFVLSIGIMQGWPNAVHSTMHACMQVHARASIPTSATGCKQCYKDPRSAGVSATADLQQARCTDVCSAMMTAGLRSYPSRHGSTSEGSQSEPKRRAAHALHLVFQQYFALLLSFSCRVEAG